MTFTTCEQCNHTDDRNAFKAHRRRAFENRLLCNRCNGFLKRNGSPIPLIELRTPSDRFWVKVDKTDTCWLWTASVNTHGYGQFRENNGRGGPVARAHRFAYEDVVGPIPEGAALHHECLTKRCVNPEHLTPMSRGDNARLEKERQQRELAWLRAKVQELTDDEFPG